MANLQDKIAKMKMGVCVRPPVPDVRPAGPEESVLPLAKHLNPSKSPTYKWIHLYIYLHTSVSAVVVRKMLRPAADGLIVS